MSFGDLLRLGRVVVWSGTLQVVATTAAALGVARLLGVAPAPALVLGFLAAHSSTAIVLKTLADRGELDAPHGRIALGILLIQDLALIPMVLLTRLLSADVALSWQAMGALVLQAGAAVAAIVVAARLLIPALLRQIRALAQSRAFHRHHRAVLRRHGVARRAVRPVTGAGRARRRPGDFESEYSHQRWPISCRSATP